MFPKGRRSVTKSHRSRWVVALLPVVVVTAGCGSQGSTATLISAGSSAAKGSAAPTTTTDPSSAGTARQQDPLAPRSYRPVVRDGSSARRTPATREVGGFSPAHPVTYPDGISVTVRRYAHGVEKGRGPGVFLGRPYTEIVMSLSNGSTTSLDLNSVVVTATYGSPARIAPPVYEVAAARDFSGTVATGSSANAEYVFAIPTSARRTVVMRVDFDGKHEPAVFSGSVQ